MLHSLLIASPANSNWWQCLLIYFIRIATAALLLRTYIAPWILALTSRRIRVNSISLRSIRGLYLSYGSCIWQIDRITYIYALGRFTLKFEGVSLQFRLNQTPSPVPRVTRPSILFTPFLLLLRFLFSALSLVLEPILRPFLRYLTVFLLRSAIFALPAFADAFFLQISNLVLTFPELPHISISLANASAHTTLEFTPGVDSFPAATHPLPSPTFTPSHFGSFRRKLNHGLHRTWNRASSHLRGAASLSLSFTQITAINSLESLPFFSLPDSIFGEVSLKFIGYRRVEPASVAFDLQIGACHLNADHLSKLYQAVSLHTATKHRSHKSLSISLPSPSAVPESNGFWRSPLSLGGGFPSSTSTISSPKSPYSPFLETWSASVLRSPFRTHLPVHKITQPNPSPLWWLKQVRFSVSSTRVTTAPRPTEETELAFILESLTFIASPSDPENYSVHRENLGCHKRDPHLDPDPLIFNLNISRLAIDRTSIYGSTSTLFSLSDSDISLFVSQWPSPWLAIPLFITGNPNAPLVQASIMLGMIDFRLEPSDLLLFEFTTSPDHEETPSHPHHLPPLDLPRIHIDMSCGSIFGILIPRDTFGIQVVSDGLNFSCSTFYDMDCRSPIPSAPSLADPYRFRASTNFLFHPLHVFAGNLISSSRDCPLDEDRFCTLGPIESAVSAISQCSVFSCTRNIATVDLATLFIDVSIIIGSIVCHCDQPPAVAFISSLLSTRKDSQNPKPQSLSLAALLPAGLVCQISCEELSISLMASDINPECPPGGSIGMHLSSGLSFQYAAIHPIHMGYCQGLAKRSETRHKLYLEEERLVNAFSAAKTTQHSHLDVFYSRMNVSRLTLTPVTRSNLSSPVRRSPDPAMKIRLLTFDVVISTDLSIQLDPSVAEKCSISVHVPAVEVTLSLFHAYAILVAAQTFHRPPSSPSKAPPPISEQKPSFFKFIEVKIGKLLVQVKLLEEHLQLRLRSVVLGSNLTDTVQVRLAQLAGSVSVPTTMGWEQCDLDTIPGSQELIFIRDLNVVQLPAHTLDVQGESGRFRIPSGYVLSNLINDLSVSVKAIRHLHSTTTTGVYSPLDTPEAEGPKSVPNVDVTFRVLVIELADDPFESRLNLIWRASLDGAKSRMERENAFQAKVAAVLESVPPQPDSFKANSGYTFGSQHTIPIEEAHERLNRLHYLDHFHRLKDFRESQTNTFVHINQEIHGHQTHGSFVHGQADPHPPLVRLMFRNFGVKIGSPSFPLEQLPHFLNQHGHGLPLDSQFSLLVPLHLSLKCSTISLTIRDYPCPLLDVPATSHGGVSVHFDTDLVIAEEMGSDNSVDWISCAVRDPAIEYPGFVISVPKTIMPVKSYAAPTIRFSTEAVTRISWSISYAPAIQDITRIFDTITSPPRDSSPPLGFWDKIRLVFHWKFHIHFKGAVQFHMKGSRDPYHLRSSGAGFALVWIGNPKILIGQENSDRELVQVLSDSMLVVIPSSTTGKGDSGGTYRKVCAKLSSGVRFGVGFVLERSCGMECQNCQGHSFHRKCRLFDFSPHYAVHLEKKAQSPIKKSPDDSFNTFRSDFIHMSLSLTSSARHFRPGRLPDPSSLHLTSKVFKHFWSWWSLFDGVLSLPIRGGSYFPARPASPKIGRHISTLKYRISVPNLFVMHAYIDDSQETWTDGVTPWVGVKARIALFQVDMHQRDQERVMPGPTPGSKTIIRQKRFYAAELVMQELDLRVLLAVFPEKLKSTVTLNADADTFRRAYRTRSGLPKISVPSSPWYDRDDFIEVDWSCDQFPVLHLLPVASCPRFTYFKKNIALFPTEEEMSKFGQEDTHNCLIGHEPGPAHIQLQMLQARLQELRLSVPLVSSTERADVLRTIDLLEKYTTEEDERLRNTAATPHNSSSFVAIGAEWAGFDHVYQVHFPRIFVDPAIRDILIQYYHCSQEIRGFDYHIATRAVKYILDQAEAQASGYSGESNIEDKGPFSTATLRKMLSGDAPKLPEDTSMNECPQTILLDEPLQGWAEGVSRTRDHCCYLLKPQLVLRSDHNVKDYSVIAAAQARLQADAYMDDINAADPINGKIMSRIQIKLSELQLFAPMDYTPMGDGIPPEILVDSRFEPMHCVRLVPQTHAEFMYDKFNRLRLRNRHVLISEDAMQDQLISNVNTNHLRDQTDLIQVNIPCFTVTADDSHFRTISNLVSKLVLFSDAHHKVHLDRLETLLFTYDFTDLPSLVQVVVDIQSRLRVALETARIAEDSALLATDQGTKEFAELRAHIQTLSIELNFLFEAMQLAQDKSNSLDGVASALLLKAWSSELSWRMLDEQKELLAKLVCKGTRFSWLSRPDSSTVNDLRLGNLQAFDGSPDAKWTEILMKHEDHTSHPLAKRNLFAHADWVILAPVGGIAIYEYFKLDLHPLKLQVDAKVGVRIMEYLWPSRKARRQNISKDEHILLEPPSPNSRSSMDSPAGLTPPSPRLGQTLQVSPALRRIGTSRSFTDLRTESLAVMSSLTRTHSSEMLNSGGENLSVQRARWKSDPFWRNGAMKHIGDASEMKTRSSQKSFVLVQISVLDLVLSIQKDDSFVCRDARIRTRALEYRNQTWSFEELVNQFIPADMSWKGWLKMAFHQPLVPVFPVARELIAKTKLLSAAKRHESPSKSLIVSSMISQAPQEVQTLREEETVGLEGKQNKKGWRKTSNRNTNLSKPGPADDGTIRPSLPRTHSGKRILNFFQRSSTSRSSSISSSLNTSDSHPSIDQDQAQNGKEPET